MGKLLRNNRCKNYILKMALEKEKFSLLSILEESKMDKDLLFVCNKELLDKELIENINLSSKEIGGKDFFIISTSKGNLFYKDGGFPADELKLLKEFILKNKSVIISIIALIISILSYLKE